MTTDYVATIRVRVKYDREDYAQQYTSGLLQRIRYSYSVADVDLVSLEPVEREEKP